MPSFSSIDFLLSLSSIGCSNAFPSSLFAEFLVDGEAVFLSVLKTRDAEAEVEAEAEMVSQIRRFRIPAGNVNQFSASIQKARAEKKRGGGAKSSY